MAHFGIPSPTAFPSASNHRPRGHSASIIPLDTMVSDWRLILHSKKPTPAGLDRRYVSRTYEHRSTLLRHHRTQDSGLRITSRKVFSVGGRRSSSSSTVHHCLHSSTSRKVVPRNWMKERKFKRRDGSNYSGGNNKLEGKDLGILIPTRGGCCDRSYTRHRANTSTRNQNGFLCFRARTFYRCLSSCTTSLFQIISPTVQT